MGLFNRNNTNRLNEKIYEENGYIIGIESKIIYHVPKAQPGTVYLLPNGTTGLTDIAISEMRSSNPKQIVVPGTYKSFNYQFFGFENLSEIVLQEGVESVKCTFNTSKNAVDIKLPTTIKSIGRNNYPITQHLTLPMGVVEIDQLFASHDTNLLSVNIPGTLKVIPSGAFNQCKNLQSVIFNEGVESSERDVFRGTNNLRMLEIPSTYNGVIELPMEARAGSNIRGNSRYDVRNFAEEQNSILKIKIKRDTKQFELNIRRGETPTIYINQNKVQIRCSSNPQMISIDCTTLEQGEYDIEKGIVSKKQALSPNSNSQEEIVDKLELIFQKAILDNLDDEDFELDGLYGEDRDQVIEYMRVMFMQQASMNILRTDSNNINMIFNKAVSMLEQKKSNQGEFKK